MFFRTKTQNEFLYMKSQGFTHCEALTFYMIIFMAQM